MTRNVFQFGNRYFLQLTGTAMGTPCACVYATLYYSYWEETNLLQDQATLDSLGSTCIRRPADDAVVEDSIGNADAMPVIGDLDVLAATGDILT